MQNKYKHKKQLHKNTEKSYIRLRLCVTKSNQHIYAQVINDAEHKTLCSCSTVEYSVRSQLTTTSTCNAANIVGHTIGIKSVQKGITHVIFDKRNKPYHGKIQAVADAARKAGLIF